MRFHAHLRNQCVENTLARDNNDDSNETSFGRGRFFPEPAAKHERSGCASEAHDCTRRAHGNLRGCPLASQSEYCRHGPDSCEEVEGEEPPEAKSKFDGWSEHPESDEVHGEMQRTKVQENCGNQPPPFSGSNRGCIESSESVESLHLRGAARKNLDSEHCEI